MLLEKEEFMAAKEEIVEDVLVRLREIARDEAQLLFREAKSNPSVQIPDVAVNISIAITRCHDMFVELLEKEMETIDEETRRRLVVESLPRKLVEVAGNRLDDLPEAYTIAMIAASLSSKMVYNEGISFIDEMSDALLAEMAGNYIRRSDQLNEIISAVQESDLSTKDDIVEMLRLAG